MTLIMRSGATWTQQQVHADAGLWVGRYAQMLRMAHAAIARNVGSWPTMLYVPLDRIWSVPDICPGKQWPSWCNLGVEQFLTLLWQLCALSRSSVHEQASRPNLCSNRAEAQHVQSCHMPQSVVSNAAPRQSPPQVRCYAWRAASRVGRSHLHHASALDEARICWSPLIF